MTAAQVKQLSKEQVYELAQLYVASQKLGEAEQKQLEERIVKLVDSGAVDKEFFVRCVQEVEQQEAKQKESKPQSREQAKASQSKQGQQQQNSKPESSKPEKRKARGRSQWGLWVFFKLLRIASCGINAYAYLILTQFLFSEGLFAPIYAFIQQRRLLGYGITGAIALVTWFGFQRVETVRNIGRATPIDWAFKTIAYAIDFVLCFNVFPFLNVPLSVFVTAGIGSDISYSGAVLAIFSVVGWELIDLWEAWAFGVKPSEMGFWGVEW